MDDKAIINLIEITLEEKMRKNPYFIRYSFFEVRVKHNLSEEETDRFLERLRIRLENDEYKVYLKDAKFVYKNANMTVQPNELLIAVKEE